MRRLRIITLAALSVSAFGAFAAAAAEAAEGPFWVVPCHKVIATNKGKGAWNNAACTEAGGTKEFSKRLLGESGGSGPETHAIEVKALKPFKLANGKFVIECKEVKVKPGAINVLNGSTGANAGRSLETLVFTECTITGNGTECTIKNKEIETTELENALDFSSATRAAGTPILVLFKAKKSAVFATIASVPPCTVEGPIAVEGTGTKQYGVAAEAWSGGKPVLVGSEPGPALSGELNFPAALITPDWVETNGVLTEIKPKLAVGGIAAKEFEGRAEVKLKGALEWCIGTNAAGSKCIP